MDKMQRRINWAKGAGLNPQYRRAPLPPLWAVFRERKSQKATRHRLRFEANRQRRLAVARIKRLASETSLTLDSLMLMAELLAPELRPLNVPAAIPVVMLPRQLDELRALGWDPKPRPTSSASPPESAGSSPTRTA